VEEIVQKLAARFAPPRSTAPSLPPEPIRHWRRVEAVMKDGPCTYLKIARRLDITRNHANTILERLVWAGLVVVVEKGKPGPKGPPSVYALR
jgi:predicted ArsR family transcriptional regulator